MQESASDKRGECRHRVSASEDWSDFDIRLTASSFRSVRALWTSYQALHAYFLKCADDETRDGRERQKFRGLLLRLASPDFLCDLGLLYVAGIVERVSFSPKALDHYS